jgi:uncharacterized protein YbjT (DUF2867 family)
VILVTGATGTVGREVVAQLVAGGHPVRAMTRNPEKAKLDAKVQIVAGDLTRPDSLAAAVAGVDAVFSLAAGPMIGVLEANLARAAKSAGVKRIVSLSVLGAGKPNPTPIVTWHEAGERAIAESGVPWTYVRPGGFMSNALQWAGTIKAAGKVFSPYGEGKLVPIHPRDIAAVAVLALTTAGHEGKAYGLTGSEPLSTREQTAILSEVAGRPIAYVPIDDATARENMIKAGLPAPIVDSLLQFAANVRAGKGAEVAPDFERVTGRKPLRFVDWARENAAAFR